jgi:hypothetical protein
MENSGYVYSESRLLAHLLHLRNKTSSIKYEKTFHEYRKKYKPDRVYWLSLLITIRVYGLILYRDGGTC